MVGCDHVGLCAISSSHAILIDSTRPTGGQVYVFEYDGQIVIEWKDFEDKESGIEHYEIGVGTYSSGQDVMPFHNIGSSTYTSINDMSAYQDGKEYYFQIKVRFAFKVYTETFP